VKNAADAGEKRGRCRRKTRLVPVKFTREDGVAEQNLLDLREG
jgi:hypothetical protein